MPGGPRNGVLERGQTRTGPVIEQGGSGDTVNTMSFVSVQPLDSMAVNRRVAVAEKTCTVVFNESAESMIAVPFTTVQFVETSGWRPAVAVPCSAKAIESPSQQRVWAGPALTLGPTLRLYWIGSMKS